MTSFMWFFIALTLVIVGAGFSLYLGEVKEKKDE